MSASSIRITLDVLGIQNAKDAAATLYTLKEAARGVQQLSSYGQGLLPPMIGPNQGMGQGTNAYQEHNRLLTDQAKQIRDLGESYRQYETQVFNMGRTYGYMRDQAIQVADAYKQVADQQTRMGLGAGTMAYGRLTGLDPTFLAQQGQQLAQQGVVTNTGQQQQFFASMEEAVMRGSRGGYTVLASDLMPVLNSINQQALTRNPFGYGLAGSDQTLGVLSNMYASGIPGLRGQGGAAIYNQANQTLTSAQDGMGGMIAYAAYQQAHPGADFFQYQKGRQAGLQDPAFAQAMFQQIHAIYGGQGEDAEDYYGAQALGYSSPQQYEALRKSQTDAQGNPISTKMGDYQAILDRIGARKDIDTGAVGLIGRLEGTSDQAGVDEVIRNYEDLSGKKYTGKRDKASVERALGQVQTGGLMKAQADVNSQAQAETANQYEDAAQAMSRYTTQMYQFNEAVGKATNLLIHWNPQGAAQLGAAASIGGPIIGAGLGVLGTALSLGRVGGMIARLGGTPFAVGGGAAGQAAAGGGGSAIEAAIASWTGGAAAGAVPAAAAAPAAAPVVAAGGGGIAGLASTILPFLAAGGIGAGYGAIMDRLGGGEGRQGWALPALAMTGIGTPIATLGALGVGAMRHAGVGSGADDWAASHIIGYEGLFGRRTGSSAGAAPDGAKQNKQGGTYQDPVDDLIAENKRQTDVLNQINQHLADLGNPDKKAQAAYGANSSPPTMNAGGRVAPYNGIANSSGTTTGGGNGVATGGSYTTGGPYAGGVAGTGFGDPSADQVEALLKGTKLEGHGAEIIQFAKEAGVPVSVALGMIRQESGFNTPAGGTKNNFGGLKGKGGTGDFADFPDIKSGLQAVIGNMGTQIYQGKSLQDFVNLYLGGPAGGDPDAYLKNVMQLIQQLGGNAGPGSVVVGPPGSGGGGGTTPNQAGSSAGSAVAGLLARAPAKSFSALGGGGGGDMQQVMMEGRVEIVVKQPDGSTESHWALMSPSTGQPLGGLVTWPTKGTNRG